MKLTKSDLAALARVGAKLDRLGGEEIVFQMTLPDGVEIEVVGIRVLLDTIADILTDAITEFGEEFDQ